MPKISDFAEVIEINDNDIFVTARAGNNTYIKGSTLKSIFNLDLTRPNEWTGQQYAKLLSLSSSGSNGGSIAWNLDIGQTANITLDQVTQVMANPANMKPGATYMLKVVQDGFGARKITWGSAFKWARGIAPVLTTKQGSEDIISFFCDGTNMFGVFSGDFT